MYVSRRFLGQLPRSLMMGLEALNDNELSQKINLSINLLAQRILMFLLGWTDWDELVLAELMHAGDTLSDEKDTIYSKLKHA